MCTLGVIEDETHFVVKCKLSSEIRSPLFNEILNNAELNDLEDTEKLIYLMKLHPRKLAIYVVHTYLKRRNKLCS